MSDGEQGYGVSAKDKNSLLDGSPEEKLEAWLRLTKNDDGHHKAGVSSSSSSSFINQASIPPSISPTFNR